MIARFAHLEPEIGHPISVVITSSSYAFSYLGDWLSSLGRERLSILQDTAGEFKNQAEKLAYGSSESRSVLQFASSILPGEGGKKWGHPTPRQRASRPLHSRFHPKGQRPMLKYIVV